MKYRLPGLVDLQVNGFAGIDYNHGSLSPEQIDRSFDALKRTGVRRCLPTLITSSAAHFARCAAPLIKTDDPLMAGLHMEGPYISPLDGPRGAHDRAHVCHASIEDFQRRQEAAAGRIRLVTLAPEVPGARRLIEYLVAQGITVGIGHSAADADEIAAAVSAGATHSTHLGNGCFGQMNRHHNVIWPQLAADTLVPGLIVDGHHLPPAFVQSVIKTKTPRGCVLVTDAVAAAAAPPGRYGLADGWVQRASDGKVTAVGADHLAGSSLTLDDAVARTCAWTGLPLETVWAMASTQAAALVGIEIAGAVDLIWEETTHTLQILPTSASSPLPPL